MKLDYKDFSSKIKEKYPVYAEKDDYELAQAMVKKYPQYNEKVSFDSYGGGSFSSPSKAMDTISGATLRTLNTGAGIAVSEGSKLGSIASRFGGRVGQSMWYGFSTIADKFSPETGDLFRKVGDDLYSEQRDFAYQTEQTGASLGKYFYDVGDAVQQGIVGKDMPSVASPLENLNKYQKYGDELQDHPVNIIMNKPAVKRSIQSLAENTGNLGIKTVAGIQAIGSPTFEEAYNKLLLKRNDPNNSEFAKLMYDLQDSGLQSAIGALGAVGVGILTKSPTVVSAFTMPYYSALSASEQYGDRGEFYSTGNVAIDTAGDVILGRMLTGILGGDFSKRALVSALKGFGVEGGTEIAQDLLKFANNYQSAKDQESADKVLKDAMSYVKDGQMIRSGLVGGIVGGTMSGLTSALSNKINKTQIEKAKQRIKTSEAFDIEGVIKQDPSMESKIYQNSETKTLTPEFAQGRINDVAQKLDMLAKGLGEVYKKTVDINNTTYNEIVSTGLDMVTAVDNGTISKYVNAVVPEKDIADKLTAMQQQVDDVVAQELKSGTDEDTTKARQSMLAQVTYKALQQGKTPEEIKKALSQDFNAVDVNTVVDDIAKDNDNVLAQEAQTLKNEGVDELEIISTLSNKVSVEKATQIVENLQSAGDTVSQELQDILSKTPADIENESARLFEDQENAIQRVADKIDELTQLHKEAKPRSKQRKEIGQQLKKLKQEQNTIDKEYQDKFVELASSYHKKVADYIKSQYKGAIPTGKVEFSDFVDSVMQRFSERPYIETNYNQPISEIIDNAVREYVENGVVQNKENVPQQEKNEEKIGENRSKKKKTQKEQVIELLKDKDKADIKEVAKQTGILEPNIRRILGQGAKDGTFERVADGVYSLKVNGEELAFVQTASAVEALPELAKRGFKADMIFLDIPYDTPSVKGGNRPLGYDTITVDDFKKVVDAVKVIARDENTPIIHMYTTATSGVKAMQKYNDVLTDAGLKVIGKGDYTKLTKAGKPFGFPTPNGWRPLAPEGILVFNQSGELNKDIKNLNFKLVRPKGYKTEKPAELLEKLIEMTTDEGDVILDPFAGSGVTGEQAVKAGRKAHLIEKSEDAVKNHILPRVEGAIKERKDNSINNLSKQYKELMQEVYNTDSNGEFVDEERVYELADKVSESAKQFGFDIEWNDQFNTYEIMLSDKSLSKEKAQKFLYELSKEFGFELNKNNDGTFKMYHGTTKDNANDIYKNGFDDNMVFVSPSKEKEYGGVNGAGYYGDTIITVDVDPRELVFRTEGEYYVEDGKSGIENVHKEGIIEKLNKGESVKATDLASAMGIEVVDATKLTPEEERMADEAQQKIDDTTNESKRQKAIDKGITLKTRYSAPAGHKITRETEVPAKDVFAKEVVKFLQNIKDITGYEVASEDATKTGNVAKKVFNPAGYGVGGGATITLYKPNSDIGVYLSIDGVLDYRNDTEFEDLTLGTVMYRTATKDDKYGVNSSNTFYSFDGDIKAVDLANELIKTVDNASERVQNVSNDISTNTGTKSELPNSGTVSAGDVGGGTKETQGQGVNTTTSSSELGAGSQRDRGTVKRVGKKTRAKINEEVKTLLESKNYSTKQSDYTQQELDLLREYSGAGGKESTGAEGVGLLSEYYTDPRIVEKLWNVALSYVAPKSVYEPSVGTGNILMQAPEGVELAGTEYQRVSGTIAQLLLPEADISIGNGESRGNKGDFQSIFFDEKTAKPKPITKKYDLIIGNPPFGKRAGYFKGRGEAPTISRMEEYFIYRGLSLANDSGVVAYVVNSSFLQKSKDRKGKEKIARLGKLIDAYRLPEGIFADTSIGTDIVVFAKQRATDANILKKRIDLMSGDNFFNNSPERILGEVKERKNRFGKMEKYVSGDITDLDDINVKPKTDKVVPKETEQLKEKKKSTPKKPTVEKVGKAIRKKKQTGKYQQVYTNEDIKKIVGEVPETVEVQDISNKFGDITDEQLETYKNVERDGSTPYSDKYAQYLNYAGGKYYNDINYYSGNVRDKLKQLEKDKKQMEPAQYEKQKAGLEKIVPEEKTAETIIWNPLDRHITQKKYNTGDGQYEPTVLREFTYWVQRGRQPLSPQVQRGDIVRYVSGQRARAKTTAIMPYIEEDAKRLFDTFIKSELPDSVRQELVDEYNATKNAWVKPNYDNVPVQIKGMAKTFRGGEFNATETQKSGIGFLINKGTGLIAYGVGVGKTHTLLLSTIANMQKGNSKRPLFIVPKSTIEKTWLKTMLAMFPNINVVNLGGLTVDEVKRLKAERGDDPSEWIKDGELAIISHEGIHKLGLSEKLMRDAVSDLNDAMFTAGGTKRGKATEIEDIEEIVGKLQGDQELSFDKLGIDHISVDEVHNFRKVFKGAKKEEENTGGKARFANVIGGTPSKRAQKLFLLTQIVQKMTGGRNVFLASATPFENHATEVYNILSFIARDQLKQMGIYNINDFFSVYAKFKTELTLGLDNSVKPKQVMYNYANLSSLQQLLQQFIDVQEDKTLIRPDKRVLSPHLPMSSKQIDNYNRIQAFLSGMELDVETGMTRELSDDEMDGAFLKASTYSISNAVSPYFIKEWAPETFTPEEMVDNSPKLEYAFKVIQQNLSMEKTKHYGTFVYMGNHGVETKGQEKFAEYIRKHTSLKSNEVAVLNGKTSTDNREKIKEDFNEGKVKVLIGGDPTKEGIDLQNNGFATINVALGWNPTEPAQVEGRVWRQGNKRNIAPIIYPLIENSGDANMFAKFSEKGGRINDLFSYKGGEMFDTGEVDPQEKKLALVTDPSAKANLAIGIKQEELNVKKIGYETDLEQLNEDKGKIQTLTNDIDNRTKYIKEKKDRWGDELTKEQLKEYKATLRSDKQKLETVVNRLALSDIKPSEIDKAINELEGKIADLDTEIEGLKEKKGDYVEQFKEEYDEFVKNRKSVDDHIADYGKMVESELRERTDEEIAQMKQEKIAQLKAEREANAIKPSLVRDERIDGRSMKYITARLYTEDIQTMTAFVDQVRTRKDANIPLEIEARRMAEAMGLNADVNNSKLADKFTRILDFDRSFARAIAFSTTADIINDVATDKAHREARYFLNDFKKRFKLDFDVNFVNSILSGINGVDYAGFYNPKDKSITINRSVQQFTAQHEIVHLTVDNIENIPTFAREGITKERLLTAKARQLGITTLYSEMTPQQLADIEEKLAQDLEKYIETNNLGEAKGIVAKFIKLLKKALFKMMRAIHKSKGDIVTDYYDMLLFESARPQDAMWLESRHLVKNAIQDSSLNMEDILSKATMDSIKSRYERYNAGEPKFSKIESDSDKLKEKFTQDFEKQLKGTGMEGESKSFTENSIFIQTEGNPEQFEAEVDYPEKVKEWEDRINKGEKPVIYTTKYAEDWIQVVDGAHRLQAYKNIGTKSIPVVDIIKIENKDDNEALPKFSIKSKDPKIQKVRGRYNNIAQKINTTTAHLGLSETDLDIKRAPVVELRKYAIDGTLPDIIGEVEKPRAMELQKYVNKKTGQLPEIVGETGKSEFARNGDEILEDLGYESIEQAQQELAFYQANREDILAQIHAPEFAKRGDEILKELGYKNIAEARKELRAYLRAQVQLKKVQADMRKIKDNIALLENADKKELSKEQETLLHRLKMRELHLKLATRGMEVVHKQAILEGKRLEREAQKLAKARREKKREAINEIKKIEKKLKKAVKSGRGIDVQYQKQLLELLNDYSLTKPTTKTIARLNSLREFVERNEENATIVPEHIKKRLELLSKKVVSDMTEQDQQELRDLIVDLYETGRAVFKMKYRFNQKKRDARLIKVLDSTREITEKNLPESVKKFGENLQDKFGVHDTGGIISHLHSMRVADLVDGVSGYEGENAKMIRNAQNAENDFHDEYDNQVIEAMDQVAEIKSDFTEEEQKRLYYFALKDMGAETQAEVLAKDAKWGDVLPVRTTQEQRILDILRDTYKQNQVRLASVYENIENKPFHFVENYFPLKYRGEEFKVDMDIDDTYIASTTKTEKGFTIKRQDKVNKKVRPDFFGVFAEALHDQLYYIHLQPELDNIKQIVERGAYQTRAGETVTRWWKAYLEGVARAGKVKDKWSMLGKLRINLTDAMLGYKLSTIAVQPLAIFDAMAFGVKYVGAVESSKMVIDMIRTFVQPKYLQKAMEESADLRNRTAGMVELRELKDASFGNVDNNKWEKLKKAYRKHTYTGIQAVDIRTAGGVYMRFKKALLKKGYSEKEAIELASTFMSLAQANASITARPVVLNTSELFKTLFTFQNFNLNRFGVVAYDIMWNTKDIKGAMTTALALFVFMLAFSAEDWERDIIYTAVSGRTFKDDRSIYRKTFDGFILTIPYYNQFVAVKSEANWGRGNSGMDFPLASVVNKISSAVFGIAKGEKIGKNVGEFVSGIAHLSGVAGASQAYQVYKSSYLPFYDMFYAKKTHTDLLDKELKNTKKGEDIDAEAIAERVYNDKWYSSSVADLQKYRQGKIEGVLEMKAMRDEYGWDDEVFNSLVVAKNNTEKLDIVKKYADEVGVDKAWDYVEKLSVFEYSLGYNDRKRVVSEQLLGDIYQSLY